MARSTGIAGITSIAVITNRLWHYIMSERCGQWIQPTWRFSQKQRRTL